MDEISFEIINDDIPAIQIILRKNNKEYRLGHYLSDDFYQFIDNDIIIKYLEIVENKMIELTSSVVYDNEKIENISDRLSLLSKIKNNINDFLKEGESNV